MQTAARPYAAAGVALATASVIAVAPVVPRPSEVPVVSQAMRLVAGEDSIFNIPLNLFYDLVNIPYNEVNAVDFAARSLFFSGPWLVVSPTNLWGVDPGDPSHFQSVVNFLVPFPALSGMWGEDNPGAETDFGAGLGQQLWGLEAAELPVSDSCDAEACVPLLPTSPITGFTLDDFFLWAAALGTTLEKSPLLDNWLSGEFQAPFQALSPEGFTFGPDYPGYVDPSGGAYAGLGFQGTHAADGTLYTPGDTAPQLMPFSGMTYNLDPFQPIENFFQSLLAPPSTDGAPDLGVDSEVANGIAIPGTGIEIPTLGGILQAFQALLASEVVAFDPFTPGSPLCPGECTLITDLQLNYPDLVRAIGNLLPGNPLIDEWLSDFAAGTANGPTEDQIQRSIEIGQQGLWDFQNPSPPTDSSVLFDPSTLAPFYHQLWTDLGLNPPDLDGTTATPDAVNPVTDLFAMGLSLLQVFSFGLM